MHDEAFKFFKQALELNPKLFQAHHNMGILFYQKNQYKLAL